MKFNTDPYSKSFIDKLTEIVNDSEVITYVEKNLVIPVKANDKLALLSPLGKDNLLDTRVELWDDKTLIKFYAAKEELPTIIFTGNKEGKRLFKEVTQ